MEEKIITPASNKIDNWYKIGRLVLVMLLVIAVGLYSINKAIDYRYKVVFIKSPCHLCAELNQNQSQCINGCFTYKVSQYPDGLGGWRNGSLTPNLTNFNLSIATMQD